MNNMTAKKIVIIAYNGAQLLDVAGPAQVFASVSDEKCATRYDTVVASLDGSSTTTSAGLVLETVPLDSVSPEGVDTVLVVGGEAGAVRRMSADTGLRVWLRTCALSARRVGSVCTGTFALAAAGLVEGRRVATHWRGSGFLAQTYPGVRVDTDAIYVKDGNIWTSAGVTTGIDMCLALVSEDCGTATAIAIARRLVVYAHRPGSQSQFSPLLEGQAKANGPLADTLQWMAENLQRPLAVADCAAHAGMSDRTFHRRFTGTTGKTPARYLEMLRLDAARALLEREAAPLKQIAALCGFSGAQHLILVFEKRLGLSPTDYRKLHGNFTPNPALARPHE